MTTTTTPSLLSGYRPDPGVHDAMVSGDGVVREHWQDLASGFEGLGPVRLLDRQAGIDRDLRTSGVTYHRAAPDGRADRVEVGDDAWRLDAMPLVVPSEEWRDLESGVLQRAELLDAVLADLYGPRTLLHRGLLPSSVVLDHPWFLRPADGIRLPGPSQLVSLACDLGRDEDGRVVVLGDRTNAPSGAGYALENRLVMSRAFPSLYRASQVHRLAPFFRALRAALQAVAPEGVEDPRVVILSPGPSNETAWEHGALATTMGHTLVEGSDLLARNGRVWLRSLRELEPVDVVLRRVDADWVDPLEFRSASRLGVTGMVDVARRGNVSVVNPLGAGVLENPALEAFLPTICRELLGQDLRLPGPPTWWCGDRAGLAHVADHLDDLVIKPISPTLGETVVHPARLTDAARDHLVASLYRHPHRWVGQDRVTLSTAPSLVDGDLRPRHAVLRTFAVAREGSWTMMPGGLTRVAPPGAEVVSNTHGAISKDTWVLTSEPESESTFWLRPGGAAPVSPAGSMSARAAENLFWMGRYAERAEGVVRLLRVVEERRSDLAAVARDQPAGAATVAILLQTLGLTAGLGHLGVGDDPTAFPLADQRTVLCDQDRSGTLAQTIARMDDAAQVVRDQLSTDTWTILTAMRDDLASLDRSNGTTEDLTDHRRLSGILTNLLALQGLAAESMVRDPGWRFMDVGRRIERALQVIRLLRTTAIVDHGTAVDSLLYESVLTAAESIVTYRRRYRARAQLATMLDLLLVDRDNPRSVAAQLDALHTDLAALPEQGDSAADQGLAEARQLVTDAASALRLADTEALAAVTDGRHERLEQLLGAVRHRIRRTSDVLSDTQFVHPLSQHRVDMGRAIEGVDG